LGRVFRPFRFLIYGSLGLPVVVVLLLGSNLLTYSRLSHEQEVAQIAFARLDNGNHLATLVSEEGEKRFELDGDAWELDARVIKWQPWANVVGLDAGYRLERLSGRFTDPERWRLTAPRTYPLASNALLDVWTLAQKQSAWVPMLDAIYGSSVYLPMSEGVTYRITLSQSGLIARPLQPEPHSTHAD